MRSIFPKLARIRTAAALCAALCLPARDCGAGAAGAYTGELLARTGKFIVSPARAGAGDAAWFGGLAAGGLLVYSADGGIRRAFARSRSSVNDGLSRGLEKFGDGAYALGIAGALGGAAYLKRDAYGVRTALLAVQSFAAANAAGTLLKGTAGRARPYAGLGKGVFRPFRLKTSYTSFPSGHTTTAFSVASVFAARSSSPWTGRAAYALAAGTALQRVYADKHWASDVFAGAALGTAAGRWILSRETGKGSALLLPSSGPGYYGLTASFPF